MTNPISSIQSPISTLQPGRWARAYTTSLRDPGATTFLGRVVEITDRSDPGARALVRLRNGTGSVQVPADYVIGPVAVIALVACSASKLDVPVPAGDLYTGRLFQAARAWAQHHADQWLILSARYGLVHPNIWIEPYNQSLTDAPAAYRRKWAHEVFEQVRIRRETGQLPDPDLRECVFVFLAGAHYRDPLAADLRAAGYGVLEPLAGMGYGQQVAWLKNHTPESAT